MQVVDGICLLLLLFTSIRGLFRGFITEIFSVGSILLGLFMALVFSRRLSIVINSFFPGQLSLIISFLIIFLLTYLLMHLLQNMLYQGVINLNLVSLDKALGLIGGFLKGVVIIIILLTIIAVQPFSFIKEVLEGSIALKLSTPILLMFTNMIQGWLGSV